MKSVTVLGGGVVGFTVACTLRASGLRVSLIAEQFLLDDRGRENPAFSSAYPAASVIPHSVGDVDISDLFVASQSFFSSLVTSKIPGVRTQRHFELSEHEDRLPDYTHQLKNLVHLRSGSSEIPTKRSGASKVSGFAFDCYFCDMPVYSRWLHGLATRLGVSFHRRTIGPTFHLECRDDAIINCLGGGGTVVFADTPVCDAVRGVLVVADYHAYEGSPPRSYNYTPTYAVYPGQRGQPFDVYFYPRSGNCILGGTRQHGKYDYAAHAFVPEEPLLCETVSVRGIEVPEPVITLNRALQRQLNDGVIGSIRQVDVGLRFTLPPSAEHAPPQSIVSMAQTNHGPARINCVGFGGAGVTLSWGAAARVLELLELSPSISDEIFISKTPILETNKLPIKDTENELE